jgi:undecaprenyl diphosphate synthase
MHSEKPKGLHVAIIMAGNGRWATRRGLPRIAGHRAGVAALRRVEERAPDVGISCLTVYAFSSDNWRRTASEVQGIFWLLRAFLRLETERLRQRGARLQVIGRRDRLTKSVLREIDKAECATAAGSRLHLRVAIDYSSRDAITRAAADATTVLLNDGLPSFDSLGPLLRQGFTAQSGDVDLLIRTGVKSVFRISYSGSPLMPNSSLPTGCGLTLTRVTLKLRRRIQSQGAPFWRSTDNYVALRIGIDVRYRAS